MLIRMIKKLQTANNHLIQFINKHVTAVSEIEFVE